MMQHIQNNCSTLINFFAYRVFTHPFFIQLRIWNFNWVSSILLRTLFSINWVKWKTIGKNDVRGVLSLFSSTFAFAEHKIKGKH